MVSLRLAGFCLLPIGVHFNGEQVKLGWFAFIIVLDMEPGSNRGVRLVLRFSHLHVKFLFITKYCVNQSLGVHLG